MTAVFVETILVKPNDKVASRHTWGNAQRYAACAAGISWARTVAGKGQQEASFPTVRWHMWPYSLPITLITFFLIVKMILFSMGYWSL